MKKLLLILPIVSSAAFIQADFITDLQQKYKEVKDALGSLTPAQQGDTETQDRPQNTTSKDDAGTALLKLLGLGGSAADRNESSYTAVKKSNGAAKEFAQEAAKSQDPTKKKQALALLKEANQNSAKLQAQQKEMFDNLAKERAELQKLQRDLSGSPRGALFDWLSSLKR